MKGGVLRWISAGIAIGLLGLNGCKDENNPLDGDSPSNIVFPDANVSFAQHVQPLFNQTCALTGCHGDGLQQSLLRLTSFDQLMYGGTLVVVRGQPDQSTLVLRIEGRVGARMPLDRRPLNQNQINGIRAWIGEGAANN